MCVCVYVYDYVCFCVCVFVALLSSKLFSFLHNYLNYSHCDKAAGFYFCCMIQFVGLKFYRFECDGMF